MNVDFPSYKDLIKLQDTFPAREIQSNIADLIEARDEAEGTFKNLRHKQARDFGFQLYNSWTGVAKSYTLLLYFYNKGIPDQDRSSSSGTDNSMGPFSNFQDEHYFIKDWFNYYTDVFYYKLFSSLDMIGHWLNARYSLGLKLEQVSFDKALKKLKQQD